MRFFLVQAIECPEESVVVLEDASHLPSCGRRLVEPLFDVRFYIEGSELGCV